MRDAELRFPRLRMRIEERAWTARGEELAVVDLMLEHPGKVRVLTTRPAEGLRDGYEVWLPTARPCRTYVAARRLGTKRPVARPRPRDGRRGPARAARGSTAR